MDLPLSWRVLTRVTDLASGWSGCGWRCVFPVAPAPPSTSEQIPGIGSIGMVQKALLTFSCAVEVTEVVCVLRAS
eukprot:1160642-Pelagomonas_calceolata.AAC.10